VSGFEASFYIAALSALISFALVTLFVTDSPQTKPTAKKLAIAIRAQDPNRILDPIFTLGLATLSMAGSIALLAPIEPQVNDRLGQGAIWFGIQFAAFIGALAVTQPLIGSASDHYGRRRFIIAGLLFLITTTLAQGLVVNPWQMTLARLLQGISGAMIFAPALALAGDLARTGQSGAQLSVLTVAFGFGISFGQLTSGFLIRYGFITPFLFGALIAATGAVLVFTQVEGTKAKEHSI
jgi:MFS family permease